MDASVTFKEAALLWLEEKRMFIAPRTQRDYAQCIVSLTEFFGELALKSIHVGHVREYQKLRQQPHPVKKGDHFVMMSCGATRINHEVSCLTQVLKEAGLWDEIAKRYKPLPIPRPKVGQALSKQDEQRLFFVAQTRKRWMVAYCCALITANTTAGASEVLNLRLGDVDITNRVIFVRGGTKNKFRVREIPLNDSALWAVKTLLERAKRLGASQPNHCILPHCKSELTVPMYGFRRAWVNMRKAAGMPTLRFYDLRHTAITKLLENPDISEQTVKDIAGHVSKNILQRYSHIRRQVRSEALSLIDSGRGNIAFA